MEAWPGTLQQKFNVDSFGVTFGDTRVKSDVEVGQAKMRSRYTKGIDVYTSSIDLDISLWTTLDNFYKITLNNGVKTFAFYNPLTNTTDEFRFTDPPDVRPLGGRVFRVSMKWERMP